MISYPFRPTALIAAAFVWVALAAPVYAGAIITTGGISIGVFDQGHLGFSGTGLSLAGVGDALTPGCMCEGWGFSGNGLPGWASVSNGGISNVVVDGFGSTATTATSTVHLTPVPGLQVVHAFAPSAGAPTTLFQATVTMTNTGAAPITDVRYARSMDWDVPPTTFSEFVTIGGLPAGNVIYSSDNGFATPNPMAPGTSIGCAVNANFTDCGPADHGAFFIFSFGNLAPGASQTFSIFYGATFTESAAMAALGAVGAEIFSLGQSNGGQITGSPGTYIFGFAGVGGVPVGEIPEPSTLLTFGAGLAGLALWRLRRAG